MTESQFLHAVELTLAQIEAALDEAGIDADSAISGLVLTIDLDAGARIVINAQTPTRQLWLAARSGGMHFVHDGVAWHDLRTGEEFFDALSRVISTQTGTAVCLQPR